MSGQPNRIRLLADGEAAPAGCAVVEARVPYLAQEAVFRVAVAAGRSSMPKRRPVQTPKSSW